MVFGTTVLIATSYFHSVRGLHRLPNRQGSEDLAEEAIHPIGSNKVGEVVLYAEVWCGYVNARMSIAMIVRATHLC